ncbi:hypothetical protein [Asticcacaulis tiandongensis]|uniref:hypothetical protein n=1 Tax=Asticcacaulis tiandongensis TaxID=2565365 RepID=UPI001128D28B|nr:hypothetical protein [Asticcacaulis tiandongensis]
MRTFLDITAIIADGQHLSARSVPTLLRRVRLFDKHGLLPVEREDTGRREGRLDVDGACLAAIFCELLDMGFDVEMCREVAARIRKYDLYRADDAPLLEAVIDAIGNQSAVALTLQLILNGKGEKFHRVRFDGAETKDPLVTETQTLERQLACETVRGETRLDLNVILAPVIAAYGE